MPYLMLPTVGNERKEYREDNPYFEVLSIFWEDYMKSIYRYGSKEGDKLMDAVAVYDSLWYITCNFS